MGSQPTVGQRIRAARANTKHTQLSLALAAGVSPQTIWRYEHDETARNVDTLTAIAKALEVPLAQLLEGGSEPEDTTPTGTEG